jgi:ubiquitin-protein ligase
MSSTPLHRARLLHDLHELTKNPYPYITLHSHPTITTACLILTPPGLPPIHLTATFPPRYPTSPPVISIQTYSPHPNVFGDYICASILNTSEGYTPAYTLKGIAIQLLSFFNSENVQQQYDGRVVDLKAYRERREGRRGGPERDGYKCKVCGFPNFAGLGEKLGEVSLGDTRDTGIQVPENTPTPTPSATYKPTATLASLPPEILIRICDFLESEQLVLLMRAWEAIGGADGVVTTYGLIRKRELQCFATKEGFGSEALGVGVRVWGRGNVR